ncbi:MAG: PilX N-terminal domain-containing pilus assembly protein [Gammaproteobacteria bacterium]|nr:PilX N-terminal domain-containing pilus assembly protein [Gammaproteobacteria bacterium]
MKRQRGAATLLLTTILLMTATLIVIFAANYSSMQQKIASNQYRSQQSYEAAEAGLEFGMVYLQQYKATVIANPNNGFINYSDSNTTNITLSNNSKFSVVYTNPIANNFNLIRVRSTGVNDDATSTKVVTQDVQTGSMFFQLPTIPTTIRGSMVLAGNSVVTNLENTNTILSGSATFLFDNSATLTASGGSSPGNIRSDIQQNNTALKNLTTDALFANYFANSTTTMKNYAVNSYSGSQSYGSILANKNGTSIWIDNPGNVSTFQGNGIVGTSSSPVMLIVNGNLRLTDNVVINGFVYVIGNLLLDSNGVVNGGLVATGTVKLDDTGTVVFNSSILNAVKQLPSMTFVGKVAGSWKDF